MMNKDGKIYVAGHRGMVGSAIVRSLERNGYHNIITRTHKELDLTRQDQVEKFFAEEKPDYVFLAAAKVGGIVANSEALADFMYDNMILEMNVIHEAWKNNCKKLLFLGSSCIYPSEFLYVDDLADGCVYLMNNYSGNETVNMGTGKELTIKELTELVAKVVGYTGEIKWDPSKPDGTPRKLLDVSKLEGLGFHYKTELEEGIRLTYEDFLHNPMRAER